MTTFLIGLVLLVVGGVLYGTFVSRVFRPDDRPTPAITMNDGVDYVPMNKYKNALINLLNIAGTGPIFGPIQGILFGPIAFLTIPIGCVISGATHDYLCGLMSMRQKGAQMPVIIRKFLGEKVYQVYNLFLLILLLLVGVVFIYTPGNLLLKDILGITDAAILPVIVVYGIILAYYLLATLFPIDKIIGRLYPVFGVVLLLSAVGVFIGMFIKGYQLTDLDLSNGLSGIFGLYPLWEVPGSSPAGTPFMPVFFVTVACGITSGFHSSQITMIGRSVRSEREGSLVFYAMMIVEGFIAMIWAAAAMGLYNKGVLVDSNSVVGEVAMDLLGPIGGLIAVLGVIILPITSGDTALRACRLMIGDYFNIDQKSKKNRLFITLALFIPVVLILIYARTDSTGFNTIWRYFAWSNQTIGVFAFAVLTVYLRAKKGAPKWAYLLSLLPGCLYMFIISSFILSQKIGFNLPLPASYGIAAVLTALFAVGMPYLGKKYAANHEEE